MLIIVTTVTLLLSLLYVVMPVRRYQKEKAQREFDEAYKDFQIKTIKRYYSILDGLPGEEIEERFDIHRAYDSVGRRFLRRARREY